MSDVSTSNTEVIEEERVSETRRAGSPRTLAATWAGVLLAPGTIITGMVAAGGSAGPGFAYGFGGLALGTIVGCVAVAFISIWGPRTGMAQMPLGRLAFGALNFVPQIFLIASLIAYNALNDLFGVNALANSLGVPFALALVVVVAIEVVVVIFGVRLMKILGMIISSVMLVICIWLLVSVAGTAPDPASAMQNGFPLGLFLLAVALGLSGSIAWTVQACDLSRVLPARTSARGVFLWVFVGMTVPLLVLG
jgi:NCS1 family nucleobase:cation symporter-1